MATPDKIGEKSHLPAGLYIVATPIGNLSDITQRAIDCLKKADRILCEDTRVTGKLLQAYGINGNLSLYHDHNGPKMRPRILHWLQEGEAIALVSDAGTPLISDPGYKLVDDAQSAGCTVVPIPGPSAAITALSAAGMPSDRFMFLGFPPVKSSARQKWFTDIADISASLIFYESTKRIPDCIHDLAAVMPDRPVAVCRELTKKFEEIRRGTAQDLASFYTENGAPKGEAVVIIGPNTAEKKQGHSIDEDKLLAALIEPLGTKGASKLVADLLDGDKKALYKKALDLKG